MRLESKSEQASGCWSQTLPYKKDTYYRLEAVITCDLAGDDPTAGFVLTVEPTAGDAPHHGHRQSAPVRRASSPVTVRTRFHFAGEVKEVRVTAGIHGARGWARIHEMRMIPILDPDEQSHPLALPAPPHALPAPRRARRVAVFTAQPERPIVARLAACPDIESVSALSPTDFAPQALDSSVDAVLLPDDQPPAKLRTLSALLALAEERIVIVSLPAFAAVTGEAVALRRIDQLDDPTHARVTFANYATRGFALHDVFPFAWTGKTPGSFALRQFRDTKPFKAFCRRHGLHVLLNAMCDQESTSDQPLALHRETPRGGLFVFDIQPAEEPGSTAGEPVLAMHLLLTMLGHDHGGIGQYVSPPTREAMVRDNIREMGNRFIAAVIHEPDAPPDEIVDQLVTLGREDQDFGLPLRPKPVILIRSGLTSGDAESVFAALFWIKQLLRMPPYTSPYAAALGSRFRIAWVPSAAGWCSREGWLREGLPPSHPLSLEFEGSNIAAMIDLASHPRQQVRVAYPEADAHFAFARQWLPALQSAFLPAADFTLDVEPGSDFADRDAYAWRGVRPALDIVTDPDAFDSPAHHDARATGARCIRIDVPGHDADFTAHSIERTNRAATMLEQVVGLTYGLVAVNRTVAPVHFNGFPPVPPGEMLLVSADDALLQADATRAG